MKTDDRSRPNYHKGDRINQQFVVLQDALIGGMGEVYKCQEENSGGIVAVKTLRHDRRGSPLMYDLLKREAVTWLDLGKQRNIVLFHSVLSSDSLLMVVSEWIESDAVGRSNLVDWLRGGPLPVQLALDFAMDIGRGLLHAQYKVPGIVHRDLKPSNILIGLTSLYRGLRSGSAPVRVQEQVAKIGDWGLATVADEAERREIWPRRGNMVGTWLYMAPEQWNGWRADLRTDVYALGCILFEMLTGRPPYPESTKELLKRCHTLKETPGLPARTPHARYFQGIINRCMAKNLSDRYDDLHEFIYDLARVYEEDYKTTPRGVESDAVSFDESYFCNRGFSYVTLDQYEKALGTFEEALRLDPSSSHAHFGRAIVHLHRGDYHDAVRALDKAIQISPNVARFYCNRGVAHKHLANSAAALADFSKALELAPDDSIAYTNRGNLYSATGDYEKAIRDYTRAIGLSPNEGQNYHNRAVVYSEQRQQERAIQDLAEAIRVDPTNCHHYFRRADILCDIGNFQDAIKDCTRAIDCDPIFAGAFRLRAYAYGKLHAHEKANRDHNIAMQLEASKNPASGCSELDTGDFDECMQQGRLFAEREEFDKVVDVMTRAISIRSTAVEPYWERGVAFVALGTYEDAVIDLSRVLEMDPRWKHARYARADAYLRLGNFQLAIEDLNAGIAHFSSDGDYYFVRAVCRDRLGELDLAVADYDAAIKCDPNNARAYNNRAVLRQRMGQDDLAIEDFLEAYRCDPRDPDYCVGVGSIYLRRSQLREAAPYFEQAYRLGDQQAASVALQLRERLGYEIPQSEDPTHVAIELFLDAGSMDDMRRAVLKCPFMSTRIFLDHVDQMASDEGRLKHDATRRRNWLREILGLKEAVD